MDIGVNQESAERASSGDRKCTNKLKYKNSVVALPFGHNLESLISIEVSLYSSILISC